MSSGIFCSKIFFTKPRLISTALFLYTIINKFIFLPSQIEVTEEYSPDNQINDPTSDDVTLDMQKGDKANVLRKLSESGK